MGSSFSCNESRTSPICACPVCTARLISGALNREAPAWTVICNLLSVAAATSFANSVRFSLCGLSGGYAAGKFHLVWAETGCTAIMAIVARRKTKVLDGLMEHLCTALSGESPTRQHHYNIRKHSDDRYRHDEQEEKRQRRARHSV